MNGPSSISRKKTFLPETLKQLKDKT